MFCSLNTVLRRQRRRLAVLAVMAGLAGAVVVAHTAMGPDHMGDGLVMCLAVAETAVLAISAALVPGARLRRPLWLLPASREAGCSFVPPRFGFHARAGPRLQVFRL